MRTTNANTNDEANKKKRFDLFHKKAACGTIHRNASCDNPGVLKVGNFMIIKKKKTSKLKVASS